MNALGSIWWLIVSIGILVTFHEFGHFVVARWFGVQVLRFSVGFGKPLWKRLGRDGTEYVVAAIPLGGYVKMLDEREFEVDPEDLPRAFNRKPVWQRMAIAAAGPVANFLLCFVLFWSVFVIGLPDYQPVVGQVTGLAAQGGFQAGDRLRSIDGVPVDAWTDVTVTLASAAMDHRPVRIEVTGKDGSQAVHTLALQRFRGELDDLGALREIGLVPTQFEAPPVVGTVVRDGASVNLLREGDRIVSIDGRPLRYFGDIRSALDAVGQAGVPVHLEVDRGGRRLPVDIAPKMVKAEDGKPHLMLGIGPKSFTVEYDGVRRHGPVDSLGASLAEMRRQARGTISLLKRVFTEGATSGLAGPVGIAQMANAAAQQGPAWFLFFLGILSLSLGMLNLLPVPILDGGHLLYYLIELVKGSPVSERSLAVGQYIGIALLCGLMCVAFYNDLLRHAS